MFVGDPWKVREEKIVQAILDYYGEKYLIGKSVVDLGCGYGGIGKRLAKYGAYVLFSDARMEYMDQLRLRGYNTELSDIEKGWTFKKTFDITLCIGVLYHTQNPIFTLSEICKNSFNNLILETEFYDSDDPYRMLCLTDKQEGNYNHAISQIGCRPSWAMIERILDKNNMDFYKVESDKYNSKYHIYDDKYSNTRKISSKHYRGIWFCKKRP